MNRNIAIGICLCLLGMVGDLAAKVYIYIDSPATTKFPIAIPHFKNLGNASDNKPIATSLSSVISKNRCSSSI